MPAPPTPPTPPEQPPGPRRGSDRPTPPDRRPEPGPDSEDALTQVVAEVSAALRRLGLLTLAALAALHQLGARLRTRSDPALRQIAARTRAGARHAGRATLAVLARLHQLGRRLRAHADPIASRLGRSAAPPVAAVRRVDRRIRATRTWRLARWPLLASTVVVGLGVLVLGYLYATVDLPEDPPRRASSFVYDSAGNELALLHRDGFRIDVGLDQVAPTVIEAVIAAEDQRFFDHRGVDPVGLARAVVNNVTGGDTQGASTITQQLVKNVYLTSEQTVVRKLNEAMLAVKLERRDDKDAILERYLNTVYFGRGAYGIEAAARMYFATSAADLQVHQAALLVGLLRAPETADPLSQPDRAEARRAAVLGAMTEVGALTAAEADAARAEPLGATETRIPDELVPPTAPHFVEWIRAQLVEEHGPELVYEGGLRITTTLDPADQFAAEAAVAQHLTHPDEPQAAVVGLDRDGRVRAYVGGRDFDALKVDLVRGEAGGGSGRQPGSTFKPFVLAAALERGIGLGTRLAAPADMTFELTPDDWEVTNYGGQDHGEQTLVDATARSVNTVYAQLVLEVGAPEVARLAQEAGVSGELAPLPSLALGAGEVSVLDLATAYLTFARDGERVEPQAIERIETAGGEVLFEAGEPEVEQAIDPGATRALNHALQAAVAQGTGRAAQLDRPVAGKTGTTQNNGDAWFAGYTPEYAAVVWMGYPEGPDRRMDAVQGSSVTGGGLPARIWQAFMTGALGDVDPTPFAPPPPELLDDTGDFGQEAEPALPESDQAAGGGSDDDGGRQGRGPPPGRGRSG